MSDLIENSTLVGEKFKLLLQIKSEILLTRGIIGGILHREKGKCFNLKRQKENFGRKNAGFPLFS